MGTLPAPLGPRADALFGLAGLQRLGLALADGSSDERSSQCPDHAAAGCHRPATATGRRLQPADSRRACLPPLAAGSVWS